MDFNLLANIAGCLGFLLSVFTLIQNAIKRRECFKLDVLDYADFGPSTRFLVTIQNNSSSVLVIREFRYLGVVCELEPKKIRGDPALWNGSSTPRFPVRVRPHDAESVYLEFVDCEHSPLTADTWVTFQILTTSQSGLQTVLLGSKSHYLNKKG